MIPNPNRRFAIRSLTARVNVLGIAPEVAAGNASRRLSSYPPALAASNEFLFVE